MMPAAPTLADSLADLSSAVRDGRFSAVSVVCAAFEALALRDPAIGAVVEVLEARALADAEALDARIAAGEDVGPLAGVPFGVKALFDIAGLPTTAGAAMRRNAPPAARDAALVRRLTDAGAIPVAILNMDEFAYGFVTVNAHYGTTRNPHDTARLAGGSSGGSAAAVAAGMLPLTIGSDTNGSIRVPASLCGVYGFRPAWGSVPTEGAFPFVEPLDTVGPFATSLADMRLATEICLGTPLHEDAGQEARVARLGDWFVENAVVEFEPSFERIAALLGALPMAELPEAAAARAAAFLITAAEGGALHRPELIRRPRDFDPETRDRFIAGCLLPGAILDEARDFAAWYRAEALKLLEMHDVLLAPATPDVAPPIADPVIMGRNGPMPARANLGLLAQPVSLAGLPVLSVPLRRPGRLPLGIQMIGAPGREAMIFALAKKLEAAGIIGFSPPPQACA